MDRRQFIRAGSAASAATALGLTAGCASTGSAAGAKVVVVGGGYGGATAAKYIRMWSEGRIEVTLVEPNDSFVSCPLSNLVLGGSKQMADITTPYDNLTRRHGVKIARDRATAIDADKRQVRLAGGQTLAYDRLVLSPGVDFMWDALPGMKKAGAQDRVLHAWKAGPQTLALRKQLEAMPDGGVYAISIPLAPYRCPPGPYERACQVAHYFSQAKPKSKVLILDGNDDVTSKGPLFKKAWADRYKGIIEYRPKHSTVDVDTATNTLKFDFNDDVKAQVLNVIPPQRAGDIAHNAGLTTANRRWCEVDWLTMESTAAKNIHILGDALQIAPQMPKSGHMANQHGKVAAAAIVALLSGRAPNALPIYNNTCYSFVSDTDVVHVASVHRYDAEKKTMLTVPGSGGVSAAASELEGRYGMAWARNIWADTLA
ncbi:MAG TPA: NAD(P)/FAD-dependent oxidoreductase [Alicycliphilus sp.]|jgi:NADPH-dependent 2,4-dienoyl-CoA reductase/sulfur reductase-like enzyme|uniref:NAD(P)/FAD-dependent oxidoreductase n=1 Tax=Diaphorobacter limosus TaxID=3036128 RepID=A0ABZ0J4X0_9BURK|nr:NAD(P)/FAD-dependent oxidoreductase [Diaphorobacter sp. Y-1]MBP6752925.1 FAD-dependent oxidoreductase [Alicycliphilus sp.]MCA0439564.1 NAD(P)/FAD-dependent oxidoreductase [Pseudomonadota bacterium]MBP7326792.1 FAD-dependent oxidoreductase [Alicycliphilus sp.]MBP7330544.1 FAD-dependent oxidoreductase [Alicycliphilus sp.]MBP8138325.1 FAD-dependent oxidoreductase [Alicycliphilus sp.]